MLQPQVHVEYLLLSLGHFGKPKYVFDGVENAFISKAGVKWNNSRISIYWITPWYYKYVVKYYYIYFILWNLMLYFN